MNINNKLYISLAMGLGSFTYLINFFNKIYACSLVFVFLMLTANIIVELYGKSKAILSVIIGTVISFYLLGDLDYYIAGRVIHGLVVASLIAVVLSAYFGISMFTRLRNKYGFNRSSLISIIISSIIDGLVMVVFFVNQFSINKVLSILAKEVYFKCLYSIAIYICILSSFHLVQKMRIKSKVIV